MTGRVAACGLIVCSSALVSCSETSPSTLDPAGPGAARIAGLWWVLFWIAAAIFAVVLVLMGWSLRRSQRDLPPDIDTRPAAWGDRFIGIVGVAIPVVILMGSFVYSLTQMNSLAGTDRGDELAIEVIGHNWWWEVRYPNGAVTANEIHIPTGQRVRVMLTTDDVLHSFWVPRLQAKMDQVPGQTNEMWLQADSPGRYRGQCAEFCGLQHAHMAFFVEAEPPAEFEQWYATEAQPAADPSGSSERGQEVFLTSTCLGCHAIRGTRADSRVGPDLTHLGGRETLFAGTLPNTRVNLERIIVDPQSVKPGVGMPPTALTDSQLQALLDYLMGLR